MNRLKKQPTMRWSIGNCKSINKRTKQIEAIKNVVTNKKSVIIVGIENPELIIEALAKLNVQVISIPTFTPIPFKEETIPGFTLSVA